MNPPDPKLIVVVDDSELFCEKMVRFFKDRYGDRVTVETYTDPLKGLVVLSPNIDLLIVDLEMPTIDGKKFLGYALQKGMDHRRIIITSFRSAEILHQKFQLSDCLAVIDKNDQEQQQVFAMIADSIVNKH
ncbi:MAG TPA: response regulator [Acidobacteriota bacterium]|nr:response regulator [Acidobacteriota bacterium]